MFKWQITESESGTKLITYLKEKLGNHYSSRYLKRNIDRGQCFINHRAERFSSTLVGRGDIVEFKDDEIKKVICPIIYENDNFQVINKSSGVISEKISNHLARISPRISRQVRQDVALDSFTNIREHCSCNKGRIFGDEDGVTDCLNCQRGYEKCGLVHRLDRDTSGVMIIPKTEKFSIQMIELFKKRKVKKEYLAIVDKIPKEDYGVIESKLGKIYKYDGQTVWGSKENGKLAITHWKKLKEGKNCSLILCQPVTGRTHQIRIHLSEMGHPILGDHQYGKTNFHKRHLLHAWKISFMDYHFEAQIPEDFHEVL